MKKWVMLALMLAMTASVNVAAAGGDQPDILEKMLTTCLPDLEPRCWQSLADALAQLKQPATEAEREDQMIDYWMLAKTAYWTKDFSDSARFFNTTQMLAKDVRFSGEPEGSANAASATVGVDIAALDLTLHDYVSALRHIDTYISVEQSVPQHSGAADSVMLLRDAALIGLERNAEAETAFQDLLRKLDYEARGPWEGSFPIGPRVLNPYEAARRIAAYYMRSGHTDQALKLLEDIKQKRQSAIDKNSREDGLGALWAEGLDPADILHDEAEVYLLRGQDDQAETLLRASLDMRSKSPGRMTRQVLTRLAELDRRSGKNAEADEFAARAAAIHPDRSWSDVDPLTDTLGFAQ